MRHRLLTLASSVLVVAVVGAGVALAAGSYHGGGNSAYEAGPKKHPGKKQHYKKRGPWQPKMTASRLSWSAYLTGEAEIDADGDDAGDPDAKGSASFLVVDQRTVCYGFGVRGAGTPTAVHIHQGEAGTNGPPVVEFANVPKDAEGQPSGDPGASSGCKVSEDPDEIAALRRIRRNMKRVGANKAASRYYVNVHTDEFPAGAVRGQLSPLWFKNQR